MNVYRAMEFFSLLPLKQWIEFTFSKRFWELCSWAEKKIFISFLLLSKLIQAHSRAIKKSVFYVSVKILSIIPWKLWIEDEFLGKLIFLCEKCTNFSTFCLNSANISTFLLFKVGFCEKFERLNSFDDFTSIFRHSGTIQSVTAITLIISYLIITSRPQKCGINSSYTWKKIVPRQ